MPGRWHIGLDFGSEVEKYKGAGKFPDTSLTQEISITTGLRNQLALPP
jgi:hypothetical protein